MNFKRRFALPDVALPWHQQLVMRIYLGPFVANTSEFAENRAIYENFSEKIVRLASEIPFSQHGVPVLVPAQVGLLEDTRYWSIAQTLEHLTKVDGFTKKIILSLAAGKPPGIRVTPALVAPTDMADPEKIFEDFKSSISSDLDEIDDLMMKPQSQLTEIHPFFGPFNAKQWYWSLGMRNSLRYRQLKNIRKGLTFDPADERQLNLSAESPDV